MIRKYTHPILLSSYLFTKSQVLLPLSKFINYKPSVSFTNYSSLLVKNYTFGFAELPKHKVLNMPALSPTMTQGKIVKWNVKVGDQINQGDVICQVETDKATMGFQSTEKGYIAQISKSDAMVTLGTPVAILTKKADDVKSFNTYQFGASTQSTTAQTKPEQPKQSVPQQAQSSPSASSYPKHNLVKLPAVSPTMTEGKILQWKVKVGDSFDIGDSLFSIETDKATVDYQATEKGFVAKIINEGSSALPVGEPVAVVTKKKEDIEKFKDFKVGSAQQDQLAETKNVNEEKPSSPVSTPTSFSSTSSQRIFASPLAKTLAQQKGIALSQVKGSGPDGRILKQDIEDFKPSQVQSTQSIPQTKPQQSSSDQKAPKKPKKIQVPQNPYQQIPLTSMRKTIANRLTQSKTTIPHYYINVAVQMGKVLELRQQLNKNQQGIKISAVALALRDVPDANAQWHGTVVRKFKHSDVSVAVATDGGLITPIVHRAQTLGLLDIARKTKDLAKRAREGKLDPAEFIGGTTSVSNLGMFGIDSVTSVINPPQSTILGVGQTVKKVVFDPNPTDPKSPYKVIDSMELVVSADHRVVDGALAAKWLSKIKKYLQDPVSMLL